MLIGTVLTPHWLAHTASIPPPRHHCCCCHRRHVHPLLCTSLYVCPSPSSCCQHHQRCCATMALVMHVISLSSHYHCHRASPSLSPLSPLLLCQYITSTVVPITVISVAVPIKLAMLSISISLLLFLHSLVIDIVHPPPVPSSLPHTSPGHWSVTGLPIVLSLCCYCSLGGIIKLCLQQCTAEGFVGAELHCTDAVWIESSRCICNREHMKGKRHTVRCEILIWKDTSQECRQRSRDRSRRVWRACNALEMVAAR